MWWLLSLFPIGILVFSLISEKDYYDMCDNGDDWYYKDTIHQKKENNNILTT